MNDDGSIHFQRTVSSSEIGRPVGLTNEGVLVWTFPGRKTGLDIVPYAEVETIAFERETRTWRIVTTTSLFVGAVVLGVAGTSLLFSLLDGQVRARGLGAILFAGVGPLMLLTCPFIPILYFTRLGYYLRVRIGKKTGKYYFAPEAWDDKQAAMRSLLEQSGRTVEFPDEFRP